MFDSIEPVTDIIRRRVNLPVPVMTRFIRLEIVEASEDVQMKMDFIGRSSVKQYKVEQKFEDDHVVKTGNYNYENDELFHIFEDIPYFSVLSQDLIQTGNNLKIKPDYICPQGGFYSRWYINTDIDYTTTTECKNSLEKLYKPCLDIVYCFYF